MRVDLLIENAKESEILTEKKQKGVDIFVEIKRMSISLKKKQNNVEILIENNRITSIF